MSTYTTNTWYEVQNAGKLRYYGFALKSQQEIIDELGIINSISVLDITTGKFISMVEVFDAVTGKSKLPNSNWRLQGVKNLDHLQSLKDFETAERYRKNK